MELGKSLLVFFFFLLIPLGLYLATCWFVMTFVTTWFSAKFLSALPAGRQLCGLKAADDRGSILQMGRENTSAEFPNDSQRPHTMVSGLQRSQSNALSQPSTAAVQQSRSWLEKQVDRKKKQHLFPGIIIRRKG